MYDETGHLYGSFNLVYIFEVYPYNLHARVSHVVFWDQHVTLQCHTFVYLDTASSTSHSCSSGNLTRDCMLTNHRRLSYMATKYEAYYAAVECLVEICFRACAWFGWLCFQCWGITYWLVIFMFMFIFIFTALHGMQTRSSDENSSVRSSVRPSVRLSNAWIVTKRRKDLSRYFWEEEWLVKGDPFYPKFWVDRPPLERNRRF